MHTVTLVSALFLAAVIFLTAPQKADAVCCKAIRSYLYKKSVCGDCTGANPYCGVGKCNLFGCACAGGCRHGECAVGKKRSVDEHIYNGAEQLVSAADANGDGLLSIEEAETLLHPKATEEHRRSVRSLDKNMDGILTVNEIDE